MSSEQGNWRFYDDDAAEPVVALASENTSATTEGMSSIRIRASLTGGFANYMTAWYPINEGSGTVLNNIAQPAYCDPFPNLTLMFRAGNAATFWSQGPTLGSTGGMSANCYGMASATSGGPGGFFADTGVGGGWHYPVPCAVFLYINKSTPASFWSMGFSEVSCGNTWDYDNCQKGNVGHYASEVWNFSWYLGETITTYGYRPTAEVLQRWVFLYYARDPVDNRMKIGVVNDEGYKYDSYTSISSSTYYQINRMRLFNCVADYQYLYGSLGDYMVMHEDIIMQFAPSDWGYYYDMLRGRYGMGSRKGW